MESRQYLNRLSVIRTDSWKWFHWNGDNLGLSAQDSKSRFVYFQVYFSISPTIAPIIAASYVFRLVSQASHLPYDILLKFKRSMCIKAISTNLKRVESAYYCRSGLMLVQLWCRWLCEQQSLNVGVTNWQPNSILFCSVKYNSEAENIEIISCDLLCQILPEDVRVQDFLFLLYYIVRVSLLHHYSLVSNCFMKLIWVPMSKSWHVIGSFTNHLVVWFRGMPSYDDISRAI